MTCLRSLALLLTLFTLLGCDPPSAPKPTPPATTSALESTVSPPAAPVVPETVAVLEPQQLAEPEAKPKPVIAPTQAAPPKAVKPAKPAAPEQPPVVLDLSLPPEVFAPLQPLEPLDDAPAKLLPPLFGEKVAPESPFQLNGKLITNERGDDYWESVEGAQLQFEFKQ
ncbi:hypothetical protein [Pseudomonas sp.]|uniref:hypothetical protein n=1 Tax=Pseudomonas sp. TaxID=306 RepID=UPI003C729DEC